MPARRRAHAAGIVVGGAIAGGLATLPMSVVMFAAKGAGLMGEMPPAKITARLLDRFGWRRRSAASQDGVASVAHLAFGAAGGAAFAALVRGLRVPGPPVLAGMMFGACVWLVSYQGWVPALAIMPPPRRDRPGRPESMLVAHLVYGAALGALVGRPARREKRPGTS